MTRVHNMELASRPMTQLDRNGAVAFPIAAIKPGAHLLMGTFEDTVCRVEAVFGEAPG